MGKGKGSSSNGGRGRGGKAGGSKGAGRSTPMTGTVASRVQSTSTRSPAGGSSASGFAPRSQSASAHNASRWEQRRDPRTAGPAPAPLVDELRRRYVRLWADHARAVLAAHAHIAADDPGLAMLAARLQAGHLLHGPDLDRLASDPVDARGLLICDLCGTPAPRADRERRLWGADEGQACHDCGGGHFVDPADLNGPVPTLAERLADLRARLGTLHP